MSSLVDENKCSLNLLPARPIRHHGARVLRRKLRAVLHDMRRWGVLGARLRKEGSDGSRIQKGAIRLNLGILIASVGFRSVVETFPFNPHSL